jgi:predicted transcriptional regulator
MARAKSPRKASHPATPQGREIARTIREGERAGLTQREIATTLGTNERTLRRIKSGETSGTRTYSRLTASPKRPRSQPGLFNAEFVVGYTVSGEPVIASHNVTVPQLRTRTGELRNPTPLDVFRVRGLAATIAAERAAQARRYGNVDRVAGADSPVRLRAISTARRRTTTIRTSA